MVKEQETRRLQALKAYVAGDAAEPDTFSAFHGVPRDEVQRLLAEHRESLAAIDPARAVILESLF